MEGISDGFARNFLGRLSTGVSFLDVSPSKAPATSAAGDNDSGKVELSLGLSLNGCFGVEPKEQQKGGCNGPLLRSSSIASPSMFQEHEFMALTRTCSLPTETEGEIRKTKELQTLKRLEAKRKRIERKTSLKSDDISSAATAMPPRRTKSGRIEFEFNGCSQVSSGVIHLQFGKLANGYSPEVGVSAWAAGAGQGKIVSHRSIGSQGSVGSSGITELDNQPLQEERSPSVIQQLPDHSNHKTSPSLLHSASAKPTPSREKTSRHNVVGPNGRQKNMERNVMEEMPCVTTKGEGPNGKRIEGFLYRYKKGEEVRIVCVCHGDFLTPAEFVRHAGGGDVDHPLRHIVVYPTSAAFS